MSLSAYDGGFFVLNLQKLQQVVAWPFYKSEERGLDEIHRTVLSAGSLHDPASGVSGQFRIRIYNFLGRVKNKNLISAQICRGHGQRAKPVLNAGGPTNGKICRKILLISGGVGRGASR